MKQLLLTALKKGDTFKWGDKAWDELHRFHSIYKHGNRFLIHLYSMQYNGSILSAKMRSFTWRDSDVDVYIPKFYLSEQKKTKGKPCIPISNERYIISGEVNPINLSNVYCSNNKYWYDLI